MEPSEITSPFNGIDLVLLFGGVIVGIGIGYLYGWLHYSKEAPNAAR